MTKFAGAWLAAVSMLAVALPVHHAPAAEAVAKPVPVAMLFDLPVPPTSAATPIERVQAKTCGCTPQGKQKIIMRINGKDVCTATAMPCTAP